MSERVQTYLCVREGGRSLYVRGGEDGEDGRRGGSHVRCRLAVVCVRGKWRDYGDGSGESRTIFIVRACLDTNGK